MSKPVKLYSSSTAPNPRRTSIFIAEKGLDIPVREVNFREREHRSPEYLAIAPNGKVPALELDNGTVLLESQSICLYLEGLYPEPPLMGQTPEERARIDMWSRRVEFELSMPMAAAFRHTHPAMADLENQVEEFGKASRTTAERRLQMLNEDLSKSEYVAGDAYSIADITLISILDFFAAVGKYDLSDYTHLQRWRDLVNSREAVASTRG